MHKIIIKFTLWKRNQGDVDEEEDVAKEEQFFGVDKKSIYSSSSFLFWLVFPSSSSFQSSLLCSPVFSLKQKNNFLWKEARILRSAANLFGARSPRTKQTTKRNYIENNFSQE